MALTSASDLDKVPVVPHCLTGTLILVNGLPKYIFQLPFKMQFFFCASGWANLHVGLSVISLPTAAVPGIWCSCHYCVSDSPTLLYVVYPFFCISCSLRYQFFRRNCSIWKYTLGVCTWEEVSSGSFYAILDLPPV